MYATRCNVPMQEKPRNDATDKVSWWCPQCKSRTCPEIKGHAIETGRMTYKNYFVHRINGRIVCHWYNFVFIIAIKNVPPGSCSS